MQSKNMWPDEKRSFDRGELELITLGGVTFGRVTLQPGWKWSTCVKPIAKTESCQALLPPGHDAWVVGDEPFVAIDIQGMTHYAESPGKA